MKRPWLKCLLIAALCLPALFASGQMDLPRYHYEPYILKSGRFDGIPGRVSVPYKEIIWGDGAPWMQIHIGDYHLGEGSSVTFSALADNQSLRLNARTIPQYNNATALFNGDAVEVELHVAPGDKGAFIEINGLTVGEWHGDDSAESRQKIYVTSLCGATDDRVASTNSRCGRILVGGCSSFLVANGAVLTAGHCVDWDPDGGGAQLPDGVLDLSGVVEFQVPDSQANGTPVMAAVNDQYPINLGSVVWHYEGENQGLGKDWAMFRCNPNANTGLTAHRGQNAFFRMTREAPSTVSGQVRITGFGADSTPQTANKTQQTHAGEYIGESTSGSSIWHQHRADTMGASSGSPMIWEGDSNYTIGVHTNAGCTETGGANSGTSFEHNALENAINGIWGANTVFLDTISKAPAPSGTALEPYLSLNAAVAAVPANGRISATARTHTLTSKPLVLGGKRLMIIAPTGPALFK